MKTILIAIAACAGLTTVPAFAAPANGKQAEAEQPAPGSTGQADTKRYCVTQTPTGSRVPRKTCNTRAQWSALGVNPDELTK